MAYRVLMNVQFTEYHLHLVNMKPKFKRFKKDNHNPENKSEFADQTLMNYEYQLIWVVIVVDLSWIVQWV